MGERILYSIGVRYHGNLRRWNNVSQEKAFRIFNFWRKVGASVVLQRRVVRHIAIRSIIGGPASGVPNG